MGGSVLPLGFLQVGRDAVVRELGSGRNLAQRLSEMGIVRGTRLSIIKNDMGGPLIISVGDGRLAIGRGMALKILVEEASKA
ncbi:FeoA domain protein [Pelotomaculum sp. FP]|uniref:FeoA family protein n=1 Tax=Pelotomaculum sp. FP TaxID=261474 RepID=UPI001065C478|nr:FeoA family protein [Pelotomaculum sp. FP]TEB16726.1 FeoA domain protein [Pelotomaculum sp. FP]